jgi:hypothetical protein
VFYMHSTLKTSRSALHVSRLCTASALLAITLSSAVSSAQPAPAAAPLALPPGASVYQQPPAQTPAEQAQIEADAAREAEAELPAKMPTMYEAANRNAFATKQAAWAERGRAMAAHEFHIDRASQSRVGLQGTVDTTGSFGARKQGNVVIASSLHGTLSLGRGWGVLGSLGFGADRYRESDANNVVVFEAGSTIGRLRTGVSYSSSSVSGTWLAATLALGFDGRIGGDAAPPPMQFVTQLGGTAGFCVVQLPPSGCAGFGMDIAFVLRIPTATAQRADADAAGFGIQFGMGPVVSF